MQDIVQDELVDLETSVYNMKEQCILMTDAIIFTYFFGFSIVFWSVGHRSLVHYKSEYIDENPTLLEGLSCAKKAWKKLLALAKKIQKVIWDILKSPGFVLLILGLITACIPPLQRALFEDAGSLRIFGSTLDSLANAGGTFATIVVAASLIPKGKDDDKDSSVEESPHDLAHHDDQNQKEHGDSNDDNDDDEKMDVHRQKPVQDEETPSLPLRQNKVERRDIPRSSVLGRLYRYSIVNLAHSIQIVDRVSIKVHAWQCISRLVVTPAIVFMILLKMECSGAISSINAISKVVLLINSSCPSALVVVVILKAQGHTDAATAVSKTYLPLYSLSVLTMALWASLGLVAFQADSSFCKSNF
jgi:predicted permease